MAVCITLVVRYSAPHPINHKKPCHDGLKQSLVRLTTVVLASTVVAKADVLLVVYSQWYHYSSSTGGRAASMMWYYCTVVQYFKYDVSSWLILILDGCGRRAARW